MISWLIKILLQKLFANPFQMPVKQKQERKVNALLCIWSFFGEKLLVLAPQAAHAVGERNQGVIAAALLVLLG